jgi:hypothetical protein
MLTSSIIWLDFFFIGKGKRITGVIESQIVLCKYYICRLAISITSIMNLLSFIFFVTMIDQINLLYNSLRQQKK